MSHSLSDASENISDEGSRAAKNLILMMQEGRSYSGRERNCCFLNTGPFPQAGGRFANISAVSGLDFVEDGRAIALVDWDDDGDLDLWMTNRTAPRLRFMRNDSADSNRFLRLRLRGTERAPAAMPSVHVSKWSRGARSRLHQKQGSPPVRSGHCALVKVSSHSRARRFTLVWGRPRKSRKSLFRGQAARLKSFGAARLTGATNWFKVKVNQSIRR